MKAIKIKNLKRSFPADQPGALTELVSFVEETLTQLGADRKLVLRAMLLSEETGALFIEKAAPGSSLRVQIRRTITDADITIRASGEEINLLESTVGSLGAESGEDDEETQRAIRSILLKSQENKFKYTHKNGANQVRILVGMSRKALLYRTIVGLVLGLVFGGLLHFAIPAPAGDAIADYLLSPLQTMFMSALKIIVGPVVFFSIVTCFSQFKDLLELGRIGFKVMGLYTATTIVAVLLSMVIFQILQPGSWGYALSSEIPTEAAEVNTDVDTSRVNTIVNIVPDNIVKPFLNADTLQIIFLAALCGIAVGMIGQYSPVLSEWFEACNALFLTITTMISGFIPIAVFCSVALMFRQLGGESFLVVLGMAGTQIFTLSLMIVLYGLMILLFARLNPITFFQKNAEGMLTSFTLCSSSAAMPTNMRTCTEKLGISPKVCSFSIPLGATVNMDGTSINLVVCGLFLAKLYGVTVPSSALLSLAITVILLSLGAPGVPGAALVCLAVVLQKLGVPVEAIGLIIAINPFLDMFVTMSNTTGDVAATLIVAKSEGLVDTERFNK